jgi:hypothetical protein
MKEAENLKVQSEFLSIFRHPAIGWQSVYNFSEEILSSSSVYFSISFANMTSFKYSSYFILMISNDVTSYY